jgi:uncharacterized protein (DUF433 family)
MNKIKDFITIDKEVLGGTPVFKGTRVPVQSLFWHLKDGISISEFLEDFPTVTRDQAAAVIEIAGRIVSSENIEKFL